MFGKAASKDSQGNAQAREWVSNGALLLDVRTKAEYASGHVEQAVNIPVQELPARLAEVGSKDRAVVVYCRSGGRSAVATDLLQQAGYRVLDVGPMSAY